MNSRILTVGRSSGSFRRAVMVAALCLLGTATVKAQTAAAPGSATGTKIGVISVRQAIAGTAEGKQAGAELQSQFASRQNELEAMNKQINELRQRLEAGQGKISADESARLQRQGETMARQLQRKQDEYQEDVNGAQADVFDRIGRKMIDVLDRYARENGYVAILDSSAQNTPILFASTNIDITQDIVKLFDQAYPIKAGSSGTGVTKPAAQKPAAAAPAKPQR